MIHPLNKQKYKITMRHGQRYPWSWRNITSLRQLAGRPHKGIDYAADCGTPIVAPEKMVIKFAGYTRGYGNLVIAQTADGLKHYFAHLENIGIKTVGKTIKEGQVFGWVGSTGNSTGCHLHYEIRNAVMAIDPERWLVDPLDTLRTSINGLFKQVFGRNALKADNDYWLSRVGRNIFDRDNLINTMKFWKAQGKKKWIKERKKVLK